MDLYVHPHQGRVVPATEEVSLKEPGNEIRLLLLSLFQFRHAQICTPTCLLNVLHDVPDLRGLWRQVEPYFIAVIVLISG